MSSKLSIHERFAQANSHSATSTNRSSYAAYSRPHTEPTLMGSRSPRLPTPVLDAWTAPSPILERDDGAKDDEKEREREKEEVTSVRSGRSGREGQSGRT